ncbi:MAG TPA: DNA gyrase inhibitor YacG [Oligoflexus sp.]|uniref:DNA gyrase inhibitor YacG n=1 Tax=Oligoflexus sp. TaxID=1971216 RepID=UPI002D3B15EB|nr:DNA gyrase inhibitor YacG [Oligoflexus sp.]HYX39470.1 DNA gyrase inhibitor YacG [Oligoflexus sp.]
MSTDQKPSARIVRCPCCGQSARYDQTNAFRPFCSQRCKTNDVAAWAEESYRIPAKESAPADYDSEEHE